MIMMTDSHLIDDLSKDRISTKIERVKEIELDSSQDIEEVRYMRDDESESQNSEIKGSKSDHHYLN